MNADDNFELICSSLAKAVLLEGKTKGYWNHPQLIRFRVLNQPVEAVCEYLRHVLIESQCRGCRFDATKLCSQIFAVESIEEFKGQLEYEWQHLLNKLFVRDPGHVHRLFCIKHPQAHPLFIIVPSGIRRWEKIT